MALFRRGDERKRRNLTEEDARKGSTTLFKSYGHPLNMVSSFKYLGRMLSASYYKGTEVVKDTRKEQKKWAQLYRILVQEGADDKKLGIIY